jgi:hypothetical protein
MARLLDQTAACLDLPIDPAHRPGVIANLERARGLAVLVMAVDLPVALEPAAVFMPEGRGP